MVLSDYGYGKFREVQLKCIECDLLGVEYFLTLYTADEREWVHRSPPALSSMVV